MRFPMKLAIGSGSAFVFIVLVGFIIFPKLITSKIKAMVNLGPGTDIRELFITVPFPLEFHVYLFNVTNPMDIQNGAKPIVKEIGPFCYQEWKKKVKIADSEETDTISYNPVDTFFKKKSPGCKNGDTLVTIPHPMILGVVNTVTRQKPGALSLVNKAIKSIYSNPPSIFITEKADDILFNGILIHCGVKDFAGKAICSQLKEAPTLNHVGENDLEFSFFGPKNGTEGKRFEAYRGTRNYHKVGKIMKYDDAETMNVWPTEECNAIKGTDGTVFPPLLNKEESVFSFSNDLCRSLGAFYVKDTRYDGIPVQEFTASLGDMSKNEDEKCYCYTPETCLKKGMMDLYKCAGVPLYVSMPHFYDCDESYLKLVDGLKPNKTKHSITILFEWLSGGPVYARKRIQFTMPLEPNEKVELFRNFTESLLPIFWIEEAVSLNNTFTKPIKQLYTMKKIVKISKWLILLSSLGGIAAAGYLHFKKNAQADITPVQKSTSNVKLNGISRVGQQGDGGHDNPAMQESDRY